METLRSSPAVGAILLSISYALALFHRMAGALLGVVLAAALHLGLDDLAMIAAVFFWVYALLQLPCGLLVDLLGPRRLAVLGCMISGAGSLLFAAAEGMTTAATGRGVIATGCAAMFVSLMRHVKTNWPARQVATISGRGILVGNLGAIASAAPLGYALAVVDWRALWVGLGMCSLVLSAALWFLMKDAREPEHPGERLRTIAPELRSVLSNPVNHVGFFVLAGLSGAYYALSCFWAVPLLAARGFTVSSAALAVSGLIAGYAVGASLLGWLGDRTSRATTLSCACAGAALCWSLLAANLPGGQWGCALLLFVLGFCCGGFNLVYSLVTERNPVEHAGTVTAYVNIGISVGAGALQVVSSSLSVSHSGDCGAILGPMLFATLLALVASLSLKRRPGRYEANGVQPVAEVWSSARVPPLA